MFIITVPIQLGINCIFWNILKTIVELIFWLLSGWQNLAAFGREQNWQLKFSSSAYLQFSRQMRRFFLKI